MLLRAGMAVCLRVPVNSTLGPTALAVTLWTFSAAIGASRAERLLALASFDEVLHMLTTANVVAFRWKAFDSERLRGCHRAEYRLLVDPDVYDAFFNAPVGLRAQYARGAAHGEAANRRVISLLAPRLLAFEPGNASVPASAIEWSLCGAQSKIWIDEDEVEAQLGQIEPQIIYPKWSANSASGAGLLAPRGSHIEVKGGWFSADGTVLIDPAKAGRSEDIQREGYT